MLPILISGVGDADVVDLLLRQCRCRPERKRRRGNRCNSDGFFDVKLHQLSSLTFFFRRPGRLQCCCRGSVFGSGFGAFTIDADRLLHESPVAASAAGLAAPRKLAPAFHRMECLLNGGGLWLKLSATRLRGGCEGTLMFKDYANYDGLGLAALVKKGEVSATELLDTAIARTEAVDPKINAVVVRHDDYARRQIQTGLPAGPFTGVPFLIKDLNYLAGTRTTSGASIYKDFVAPETIPCRSASAAGVTVYGKEPVAGVRLDADHRVAPVRADLQSGAHSSGGSSGGAAAAVAARMTSDLGLKRGAPALAERDVRNRAEDRVLGGRRTRTVPDRRKIYQRPSTRRDSSNRSSTYRRARALPAVRGHARPDDVGFARGRSRQGVSSTARPSWSVPTPT